MRHMIKNKGKEMWARWEKGKNFKITVSTRGFTYTFEGLFGNL